MATNPNFVQSRAPDADIEKLFAFTRCRECARSATNPNFVQSRADKLGSHVPAIKQIFPDAEDIQSEGIRARVNNNLSERLQGTIRDRENTLRGLEGLESGQRYFDGWAINYNLFREHEGMKGQTPAEMADVNPPFTERADVVPIAATDTSRGKRDTKTQTIADTAGRRGPSTAPPTTHCRAGHDETPPPKR